MGALSGHGEPVVIRAAQSSVIVLLLSAGSPSSTTSLPAGKRPGHSHETRFALTSETRITRAGSRSSLPSVEPFVRG